MPQLLENQTVAADLSARFGDFITDVHEPYNLLTLTTTREKILEVLEYLRDHAEFRFTFLTTMCGVHYPDSPGAELCMVYMMHSLETNTRVRIKIFFPSADPIVPTATNLFACANWMEREAWDFFGIVFSGHPNLIRILNMEDMDYFPMRKEYTLEDPTRRDKIDAKFGR
ncbi:MAG: NADH-quinone oxidoreductase subunit C [Bacteroidota bacterium]